MTFKALDRMDLSVWVQNCGRFVSHHSGPGPLGLRMGVLTVAVEEGVSASRTLHIGGQVYKFQEEAQALQSMIHCIRAVPSWLPLWVSPPQSIQAFVQGVQASMHRLKQSKCPGLMMREDDSGYVVKWTLRVIGLTAAYSSSGSFSWQGGEDMTVRGFATAFPDQGGWVPRLARSTSCRSAGDLVTALNYKGSIALLSMYLCLFADLALDYFTNDFLDQHSAALQKYLQKYLQKHGQNPHPAVLMREYCANVLGCQLGG